MAKLVKIRKNKARQLFNAGQEIILVGDNVNEYHILNGWHLGCRIQKNEERFDHNDFDEIVQNFQWYLERELGRRAAYYIVG